VHALIPQEGLPESLRLIDAAAGRFVSSSVRSPLVPRTAACGRSRKLTNVRFSNYGVGWGRLAALCAIRRPKHSVLRTEYFERGAARGALPCCTELPTAKEVVATPAFSAAIGPEPDIENCARYQTHDLARRRAARLAPAREYPRSARTTL